MRRYPNTPSNPFRNLFLALVGACGILLVTCVFYGWIRSQIQSVIAPDAER